MLPKKIRYILIAIFSIFVGSQITEGALLVPYWQSLTPEAFYSYYNDFGPGIGQFYTVLTILAAIIPVALAFYFFRTHSSGKWYAVISSILAVILVSFYYLYFAGTNELFYQSALSQQELQDVLVNWGRVHWCRVVIELFSLAFLMLALSHDEQPNILVN